MKTLALLGAVFLLTGAVAAQARPVDLKTESAASVKQHIHTLAAVLEQYYPYLKTQAQRTRLNAEAARLEDSVHTAQPAWRAWLLQEKLIRTLNDPHAALYPNAIEDRSLAVELHWTSDGLVVSPAPWMHPALFPKNSQVLSIGGDTPAQLLPRLEALYSGTPGWVAEWPGFMLRYGFELRWLGLLGTNNRAALVIRTPAGKTRHLDVALTPLPDFKTLKKMQSHKGWFSWTLDKQHHIGWYRLDRMQLTGPYEQSVIAFFNAVEKAGITRVAVDLRHNGGGASLAEAPFMQYLGVDKLQDYTSTVYFDAPHLKQEVTELVQGLKRLMPPGTKVPSIPVPPQPAKDKIFHGRLYIVTGPGSFSSAMDFAADVKFNHLGKIIGVPCGKVVTGPGDVKYFPHPVSGIPFQVPTDVYTWPGLPQNALVEPDVNIPMTVKDVQNGIDPVRRWFDASGAHVASKG